ncbi:MAG: Concanavalin A-like lectin/glucanase family protein, partial [Proteiniphilum sp.]|nr:Concanavalin A-like lectin/glucanase family protein [Proteiniphilum sp.]
MKKLINYLLIFAALILLGVGCQSEEIPPVGEDELDVSEESEELRTFSLTASMPEESGSTRIAFTQVGKDVALTWEEGDQLDLLFVQGSTQVKQTVTVNNISADGKRAGFEFTVPEGIEGTFDLYGVYGGGGLSDSDPSLAVLPLITGSAPTLES